MAQDLGNYPLCYLDHTFINKSIQMTSAEFNEKYKEYLEEGHYGLDIDILPVVTYLDNVFEDMVKLPNFKYSQIKLKFNTACFYFDTDLKKIVTLLGIGIEKKIDDIVKKHDNQKKHPPIS